MSIYLCLRCKVDISPYRLFKNKQSTLQQFQEGMQMTARKKVRSLSLLFYLFLSFQILKLGFIRGKKTRKKNSKATTISPFRLHFTKKRFYYCAFTKHNVGFVACNYANVIKRRHDSFKRKRFPKNNMIFSLMVLFNPTRRHACANEQNYN